MAGTRSNSAKIVISLLSDYINTFSGAGAGPVDPKSSQEGISLSATLSTGTGADKSNRCWTSTDRALTSGNSETIDVHDFGSIDIGGGAGKDSLGQALALTGIKALVITNASSSTGNLIVGNEGTAAAWNSIFNGSDTSSVPVRPGGALVFYAPDATGFVVADVTNHLLKLAASGGAVTYSIGLIGIE